ncbi:hypothetical protein M422DRAFT_65324 [Sphaerobolus stellatus SS14]|nr:hypothetical protein M422DRAFT_65324 [Sphaerobolus stellatus SS14]
MIFGRVWSCYSLLFCHNSLRLPRSVSPLLYLSLHTGRASLWRYSSHSSISNASNCRHNSVSQRSILLRHFSQRPGKENESASRDEDQAQRQSEPASQTQAQDSTRDSPGPLPVQPVNIPGGAPARFTITNSPTIDAALTTLVGLGLVFLGGVAYVSWYKKNVLDKMEKAFEGGYDPALEVANASKTEHVSDHLRRKEQDLVDRVIDGSERGRYYLLIGSKGSGKGTMIYDAMEAVAADGVSICEAHPDIEVFRLRLGRALNFEYNEDTQTTLFQRRDPREGGPALDIERALNKLEKVALRLARRRGRPLVLIVNNIHMFRNNDEGQALLLQLQQRAESWSESGILTMVFSSDDFWPFLHLRKTANRMHVVSIYDLKQDQAMQAFLRMRNRTGQPPVSEEVIHEIMKYTGGRLAHLSKAARQADPIEGAKIALKNETGWLLGEIGLIPDCDDDVMDEQKWSSCSWLLMREFAKLHLEQEEEKQKALEAGEITAEDAAELVLPAIPYYKCRQIMTRPDFLEALDHANIINIDVHHDVRPDSMLILRAALDVVQEEGFDELLDGVRARVDEIESLHRTRELTFKDMEEGDLLRLAVDKGGRKLV